MSWFRTGRFTYIALGIIPTSRIASGGEEFCVYMIQIWNYPCFSCPFSCDLAALWMVFSVRLSVTPFWLCSHHRILMKFSGVINNGQSEVHANGQGPKSKVKDTKVKTQLNRFRTVTPVIMHKAWCCLEEVSYCFSRSSVKQGHMAKKNRRFWPKLCVCGL